jgi:hypothetical protein
VRTNWQQSAILGRQRVRLLGPGRKVACGAGFA